MTSHYYAIADAGGNIYPGTFASTAEEAKWTYTVEKHRLVSPQTVCYPINWLDTEWPTYTARGDHVVYCTVETNETVKVIQHEHTD